MLNLLDNGTVFKVFNNISGDNSPIIVEQIKVSEVCVMDFM